MTGFYAKQPVVVTGGAGMVGSALVTQLVAAEARVVVLDDFSRGQTRIEGATYVRADAGDLRTCHVLFADVFAVFNLAAYVAGVEYNQHNQATMFERNVRLQVTPIQAASARQVPHVLQTSSVCVYAPDFNHPAREDYGHTGEPHAANNGYAWAKRMGEKAVGWSQSEHAVIVRPSNIYGPRDYFDDRAHVIPALIRKALEEDTIRVNGSGHEQREFIFVEDVALGMMAALEHGAHGGVYNLGTHGGTCISIRQLVTAIQEATGTEGKDVVFTQDFNAGDKARWSDCAAIHELGWRHTIGLDEGIRRTVEWYRGER